MGILKKKSGKSVVLTLSLWILAVLITGLYVIYENDPYDPLKGETSFSDGTFISYRLIRSKVIGTDLHVAVKTDKSVSGYIEYRRAASDDEWMKKSMEQKIITLGGHGGQGEKVERLVATLPSLDKMAGKYVYTIHLDLEGESLVIADKNGNPIITRYRGSVPAWVLIPHILFIMLSMLFGIRAALEAMRKTGDALWMMWTTIITLLLGGFIFGPLMQLYAFGVLWSGFPMGWDLTDNKVVIELILWIGAAYFNSGKRKNGKWSKKSIILAGVVTILIYLIPHSLFGSAFDYTSGQGTGTGVQ